eukprot:scaffold12808_cov133-Isochrysis_galbana.AAC.1
MTNCCSTRSSATCATTRTALRCWRRWTRGCWTRCAGRARGIVDTAGRAPRCARAAGAAVGAGS